MKWLQYAVVSFSLVLLGACNVPGGNNVPLPRICAPGSSWSCVGPGGCNGGQICNADGTGYEACNCTAPVTSDGGTVFIDGGVQYIDGGSTSSGGMMTNIDGGVVYIDGGIQSIDGGSSQQTVDGGVQFIDGGPATSGMVFIDGGVQYIDGGLRTIDGGVMNGGTMFIDGGVQYVDGGVQYIDGGIEIIDGGTTVTEVDGGVREIDGGVQFIDGGATGSTDSGTPDSGVSVVPACYTPVEISFANGESLSFDVCASSNVTGELDFAPFDVPQVRSLNMTLSRFPSTSSFDCRVQISLNGVCGVGGYSNTSNNAFGLTMTTSDCGNISQINANTFTANSGGMHFHILDTGTQQGDLANQPVSTAMRAVFRAVTPEGHTITGTVALNVDLSSSDTDNVPCHRVDDDVDNDNFVDYQFGGEDCDDNAARTFPRAWRNEVDSSLCRKDTDNDGYGDINAVAPIEVGSDCDDAFAYIRPGAGFNETNNTACMKDEDGDGYGDLFANGYSGAPDSGTFGGSNFLGCSPRSGAITVGTDCDDDSPRTFPGVAINEMNSGACMKDSDQDGYGDPSPSAACVTAGVDCDDSDITMIPGQTRVCIVAVDGGVLWDGGVPVYIDGGFATLTKTCQSNGQFTQCN